jgi:two-component system, NarL family, invasion response regulator UvrY
MTILIVDDSPVIRSSLRKCIEENTQWSVCAEAENGLEAIEKVKQCHPDVVILDLSMPVMGGLEAAQHISAFAPGTAMVLFTMYKSPQLLKDAERMGISAVVSKSDGIVDHLLRSLRAVMPKAS